MHRQLAKRYRTKDIDRNTWECHKILSENHEHSTKVDLHDRPDCDNNYVQLVLDIPMFVRKSVDSNRDIEHRIEFENRFLDTFVHDHSNNCDLIGKKIVDCN